MIVDANAVTGPSGHPSALVQAVPEGARNSKRFPASSRYKSFRLAIFEYRVGSRRENSRFENLLRLGGAKTSYH